jgi:ketopantoate reductase
MTMVLPILRRRVVTTAQRHIIISYNDSRRGVVTTTTTTKKTPAIHILGAGAIGMFLAASLRLRSDCNVRLLVRDDHAGGPHGVVVMPIPDRTVCLLARYKNAESTPRLVEIPCRTITGRQYDAAMIETLLVTTKAHDAIPALQSVFRDYLTIPDDEALHNHTPPTVIILCNGALAVRDEWLALQQQQQQQERKKIPVLLGTISHGVYRAGYGSPVTSTNADPFRSHQIVHAGMGDIWLETGRGDASAAKLESLASALDQCGLHCRVVPDHKMMQKML